VQQGKIPFLRLIVPFCAGIIISDLTDSAWMPGIICLSAGAILILLSAILESYRRTLLFGISISLLLAGSGYTLHHLGEERVSSLPGEEQVLMLRLKEYPEKRGKCFAFLSTIEASGEDLSCHPHGNLLIYVNTDSLKWKWVPGDRILVRATPQPIHNNGNPCEFSYSHYLAGRETKYFCFIRENDILSHSSPEKRHVSEYSSIAARKMIESFSSAGLKGDDLGLVTALTIGEKEFLDREYLTSFSRAGVMHVMAVSGLHVGMISLFLSYLLFFFKRKLEVVKILIILLALWSFAFITGLSPSVMRATLMFSFLQAGTLLKRPGNSLNLLLASAFILLTARPSVLFEAGFQLSYLAVVFIIVFYEPLYSLLKIKNKLADYLWQMAAVSVVAQAGTFPLTVKLFNTFPLLFLISNIVIIPLSFLIMILAFILIPFSGIEPVSDIIVWALSFLSHITLGFTTYISSLPYGVISGIGLTTSGVMFLTLAVITLIILILRIRKITIRPFLISMILFLLSEVCTIFDESRKEGVLSYSIKGKVLPAFQTGRYITIFSFNNNVPAEVNRHASTRKLRVTNVNTGNHPFKATCCNYTISYYSPDNFTIKGNNAAERSLLPGTAFIENRPFFNPLQKKINVKSP
jgi:competence protein ComEC